MALKPIAAPSPHRFLPGARNANLHPSDTRAGSGLKIEGDRPGDDHGHSVPPSQFAAAPRFAHARPRGNSPPQQPTSPLRSSFVRALKGSAFPVDEVDGSSGDDEEMLDDEQDQAEPTASVDPLSEQQGEAVTHERAGSLKRRRLTAEESALTSPLSFPETSLNGPPSFTTNATQTLLSKPSFLRPQIRESERGEPLPEVFSPHRHGAKFVTGGIAATVQQWVLETGQAAMQSRRGQEYLQGEAYIMRVEIEGECEGVGPLTARARAGNEGTVNLLLAGGVSTIAARYDHIRDGTVVGIRAPTWEVELDGTGWTVAVDWRVLS